MFHVEHSEYDLITDKMALPFVAYYKLNIDTFALLHPPLGGYGGHSPLTRRMVEIGEVESPASAMRMQRSTN